MTTRIFVTTRFEGFHRWPQAPDEVAFLRDPHRHVFHVRVEVEVDHHDRDVEFILFKREIDSVIQGLMVTRDTSTWSCEQWALAILEWSTAISSVEVSEDGENGAVVQSS